MIFELIRIKYINHSQEQLEDNSLELNTKITTIQNKEIPDSTVNCVCPAQTLVPGDTIGQKN